MTNEIEDGGPAFPCSVYDGAWGMTLRDWYAGMALQGLLSEGLRDAANNALATGLCSKDDTVSDGVSKLSYTLADAMLEARKK